VKIERTFGSVDSLLLSAFEVGFEGLVVDDDEQCPGKAGCRLLYRPRLVRVVDRNLVRSGRGCLGAVVNTAKSLACVAVAFVVVRDLLTSRGRTVRRSLKKFYRLVRQHRFTVVPLAVVSVVSIVPGAEILDQMPDIARRWTDGPRNFTLEGGFAILALMLFTATLFLVGRMRTAAAARSWKDRAVSALPEAPLEPWFIVPLLIFLIGLVAKVIGFPVGLVRLALVCAIPIAIGAYSNRLRRINIERGWTGEKTVTAPKPPTLWSGAEIGLIMRIGDGIAVGLVVVAALAVARATIPVVLLTATQSIEFNGFAFALLVVAFAGILITWPIASYVLVRLSAAANTKKSDGRVAWLHRLVPVPGEQQPWLLRRLPIWCVGVSLAVYVLLGLLPSTAGRFGVLFCWNLALMSLTGIVAGFDQDQLRPHQLTDDVFEDLCLPGVGFYCENECH